MTIDNVSKWIAVITVGMIMGTVAACAIGVAIRVLRWALS